MILLKPLLQATNAEFAALVKQRPDSVRDRDENRRIPLHHAVMKRAPFEKVYALFRAFPEGVTVRDATGSVPLHYADHLDDRVTSWRITLLILMNERLSRMYLVRDDQGRLPLHRAIMAHKFHVAAFLLEKHTSEVDASCQEGTLLHLALKYDAPDEFIQLIVDKVPSCVFIADSDGDLPLHAAIDYGASLEQITVILNANKAALSTPGEKGYLPHHHEANACARLAVFQLLHSSCPAGFAQRESFGCLPIHIAVRNASIETECLECLHGFYPMGLEAVDACSFTALHLACIPNKAANVSLTTLNWLLRTCPALIRQTTTTGQLPLHILAQNSNNAVNALLLLWRAFPRGAEMVDAHGYLPLHYSVMSKQEEGCVVLDNVQCLLDMHSEGIGHADLQGRLPLHIASANDQTPLAVIDVLCRYHGRGLAHHDAYHLLPFHYAATDAMIDYFMTMMESSLAVPTSRDLVPALLIAANMDASLNVIFKLAQCSMHLFV
jgi:ankyrin repeat protein